MAVVKLVATLSSYGRRAVVVGGVADRYAGELARAGQSNRRRAGTGSASPQRATRPPLWPAGMAEGNRATFGPRVGLSSHAPVARERWAEIKMPRPGEDRSDVGGAAQFNNIGPVPLSSRFPPLTAGNISNLHLGQHDEDPPVHRPLRGRPQADRRIADRRRRADQLAEETAPKGDRGWRHSHLDLGPRRGGHEAGGRADPKSAGRVEGDR